MSISTFPIPVVAAGQATVADQSFTLPIADNFLLIEGPIPIGRYTISTTLSGTAIVQAYDAGGTLLDSATGAGDVSITVETLGSFINYTHTSASAGTITVLYSIKDAIQVVALTTTQTFALAFDAEAIVFGGGGGGGNVDTAPGGAGGGGSGFVATGTFGSGSYSVVVGSGGTATANGGTSSFDSVSAAGGSAGLDSSTGTGGSGGSGGGGGAVSGVTNGFGGSNGSAGVAIAGSQAGGSGSGTPLPAKSKQSFDQIQTFGSPGGFYQGGNGGRANGSTNGTNAAANSASGGGGGSSGSSITGATGGNGGSGIIYLVRVAS